MKNNNQSEKFRPAAAPAGNDMRIVAIEVTAIRVPLAKIYRGSYYQMSHRSTILCRITTQCGIVGEAWTGDEDAALLEIAAIVRDEISPALIGQDGSHIEACWQAARPATFNILRDRRLGLVACACVDTALWDALGKAAKMPLWKLWGGFRNALPMIAIGGYYDDLEIADEMAQLRKLGLAGVKFKVGGRSPAEDAKRVLAARAAAGTDFIICVDANQGYTYEAAREFVQRQRPLPASIGSKSPAAGTMTRPPCVTCVPPPGYASAPGSRSSPPPLAASSCRSARSTCAISMRPGPEVRPSGAVRPPQR